MRVVCGSIFQRADTTEEIGFGNKNKFTVNNSKSSFSYSDIFM